jgi:hypothetical protein
MKDGSNKTKRLGMALVVVLLIVMAIAVLAVGFLARSDIELACGQNMILKTQMDYLADSALEHAKGLILNPQDVTSEYWTGAAGQQLFENNSDYYDVNITKLGELNYRITSTAYREKDDERVGSSSLTADLRLNPCIAVRTGADWTTVAGTVVSGDVYTKGHLGGLGSIYGDAFAAGIISAVYIQGQRYANIADSNAPVSFPDVQISYFWPQYYIGSNSYSPVELIVEDLNEPNGVTLGPTAANPAGVYYRNGNLTLFNNVVVTGTLVVTQDLKIKGRGNGITAMKNFPAVVVDGKLEMSDNAQLAIIGLARIKSEVKHSGASGASLGILGALFIKDGGINGFGPWVDIIYVTAAPNRAATEVRPAPGTAQRWSPAAGAFFEEIKRQ